MKLYAVTEKMNSSEVKKEKHYPENIKERVLKIILAQKWKYQYLFGE